MPPESPSPVASPAIVKVPAIVVANPQPAPVSPDVKSSQHVFLLQLDHGRCTLEKMEEVTGEFGRERVPQWEPGMLCCRLVADDGRIVGERTLAAPDYVCVVLDPNGETKTPVATRLTSDGPSTFQVRFPQITDAARLEVYRIATGARPADAASPAGPLIASIQIPRK